MSLSLDSLVELSFCRCNYVPPNLRLDRTSWVERGAFGPTSYGSLQPP